MSQDGAIAEWRSYRRLLPWLRPYRARLALVLAISMAATGVGLIQPYLSKLMIDRALMRHDLTALALISAAMVAVTLGGYLLNIAASYRYVQLSAAMLQDIRVALLQHLQGLGPAFYTRFRLGDLMSRMNSDVSDVQRAAGDTLLAALGNVLGLGGCVAMMLWLDWRLFLAGSVLVPLAVGLYAALQRRLVAITRDMRERGADLGSLLVDTVMGMRTVVALGAEQHEIARFTGRNRAFVEAMLRMQWASFLAGAVPGTVLAASTSVVMLYGGWRIIEGQLTIGALVAFMAYHGRVFAPVQSLLSLGGTLAATRVSLARIFALFDASPDVVAPADPVPLAAMARGITLENVHFSHGREANLAGVDLFVPKGALCALLGESGAGKSTLADLLVRFADPGAGRILIDETDIRDVALADLRRTVLLVDQSPMLFNLTIAENIAFAVPKATPAMIATAANHAGLGALVARLPQGLDTPAGERGQALSAGERHRVAIARALLRRPQVLLLDEPTAALDAETERQVIAGLRAALPEATLIVITHKPALADAADIVINLRDGRVDAGRILADA